jgi:hypothetical protein
MAQDIQYITHEAGERVGVVLDLDTYQQLTSRDDDPDLLTDLNLGELLALAESSLSAKSQSQLDELLIRNAEGQLSEGELEQLDQLLVRVDHLNILKARSRFTLRHLVYSEALHGNSWAYSHRPSNDCCPENEPPPVASCQKSLGKAGRAPTAVCLIPNPFGENAHGFAAGGDKARMLKIAT